MCIRDRYFIIVTLVVAVRLPVPGGMLLVGGAGKRRREPDRETNELVECLTEHRMHPHRGAEFADIIGTRTLRRFEDL